MSDFAWRHPAKHHKLKEIDKACEQFLGNLRPVTDTHLVADGLEFSGRAGQEVEEAVSVDERSSFAALELLREKQRAA